jgi:hypothetical protein
MSKVAEFALAFAGLACALTGEILVVCDWPRGPDAPGLAADPAFWGLLGLVLCQVLWLARLILLRKGGGK